jgi:hypothetical protein
MNSPSWYNGMGHKGAAMTKDQKTVAIGAASGVIIMALLVIFLSKSIAAPLISDTPGDRLGFALPWAAFGALPLFVMLAAVGNARFLGEAIDPTLGKEDQKMIVNGRVADNTLQQFVLFLVGLLGLAVTLPLYRMSIIPAATMTFVFMRIIFWIGYRINPLYRAPGFSSTAYLNLGMLVATVVLWIS